MRDWAQILEGTPAQPGAGFYQFLREFTNYDRDDAGFPCGYTKPNGAYLLEHRSTWITENQAELMYQAMIALRRDLPFAYRVFFKHWFNGLPLKKFAQLDKVALEFKSRFSWDGSIDELEWQLRRAEGFLFRELEQLADAEEKEAKAARAKKLRRKKK